MQLSLAALAAILGVATAFRIQEANATSLEDFFGKNLTARSYPGHGKHKARKCPKYLSSKVQKPKLIVPISQKAPNINFGAVSCPIITANDFCTIFNIVVPKEAAGKKCTLEFLFPGLEQTHPYYFEGQGVFEFYAYAGHVGTEEDTWNTQPPQGPADQNPRPLLLKPGHAYTLRSGDCTVKADADLIISGKMCSRNSALSYYQSNEECPMGIFLEVS